jgi:hypothetical protein
LEIHPIRLLRKAYATEYCHFAVEHPATAARIVFEDFSTASAISTQER